MAEQYTRRGPRLAPRNANVGGRADGTSGQAAEAALASAGFASNVESSYIKGELLALLGDEWRGVPHGPSAKLLRAASADMSTVGRKHE